MASISNDPNGRRRILFIDASGQRKTIRLGKVPLRYAEAVKVRIEDLVYATTTGHAPMDETSRWLVNLDAQLYDKIAAVGLTRRREVATIGPFTRAYIDSRVDIKPRTRINLEQARRYLLECFDADKPMREFTAGDAEDFRLRLLRQGLSDNTVRRSIGRARQFFIAAIRRGLVQTNPFTGIPAAVRANPARFHYVSREHAQRVLDACPNAEWRLLFALCRFGGLRCPSEVLALTWSDVNWEHNRIRVPSPKTEHIDGKASRLIPLFPELREHLLEVFDQAEAGTDHIITGYRDSSVNLRTQLTRIIHRAGLEPWPKLFQNLRSTRETELAEAFPMHVVCRWIGNSEPVAAKHYLQMTDEHFERAVAGHGSQDVKAATKVLPGAAQNAAQKLHEGRRTGRKKKNAKVAQGFDASKDTPVLLVTSCSCETYGIPPRGLEPLLPA